MNSLFEKIQSLEKRFDSFEPLIQAYVPESDRFTRLRRDAEKLVESFPVNSQRPPLFGKLIGVKDIFHVEGFETQAGSKLPAQELSGPESTAVTLLRQVGALIVGKTVTTEFAYFGPGPTRNPFNTDHTPGGSSSGSAAAIAAGLCELAFGTQTIGSVNRPAAYCGVFGYKPSFDRISKQGVIPLSGTMDHVGLFGRSVEEIELAAGILNRGWQKNQAARKPILAIPSGPYLDHAESIGRSHLSDVVGAIRAAGFEVEEIPVMDDFDSIYDRHQLIVAAEAAGIHATWYSKFKALYHNKTAELIEKGHRITAADLANALEEVQVFRVKMAERMDKLGIDAWITPSAPGAAPKGLESTGNPVMNLPWTQAGLPTVTVPTGQTSERMPLGTQLVGRWYQDEALFGCAKQVEKAVGTNLSPNLAE